MAILTMAILTMDLPVEEGGGVARHHEHVGRLDVAVVEGVRLGRELVLDPRKVVHNGLANGEGLHGRVRIGVGVRVRVRG